MSDFGVLCCDVTSIRDDVTDSVLRLPSMRIYSFVYMDVFLICFNSKHLRIWAPLKEVLEWTSKLGWYLYQIAILVYSFGSEDEKVC